MKRRYIYMAGCPTIVRVIYTIRLSAVSMSADGMLCVVITLTALMYVSISALYLTLRNIASLSRKRQDCIVYCRNQLYIKLH